MPDVIYQQGDRVQIAGYSKHASELAERLRSQPVYEVLRQMPDVSPPEYEVSDGQIHRGSELAPYVEPAE